MSAPAFTLPERPLVLDRYRPLRPLGSGGSGSVWLARDERTGLDVALKIVPREGKSAHRAEREAEAAARLRHERCVRAYDFGGDSGHVYIAYEYVQGCTLREAMRTGLLDDARSVEAVAQVLDALAHAHGRGIVHRDVKPANVLLEDREEVSIRLLDFGLASFDEAETLTAVGDVPGTLAYISPERLAGREASPASDVWGAGLMLWEALAGGHPFFGVPVAHMAAAIERGAPSLVSERPDLPARLVTAVGRALDPNPDRRPPAAKLAHELREAFSGRARRPHVHVHRPALRLPRLALPKLALPALPALPSVRRPSLSLPASLRRPAAPAPAVRPDARAVLVASSVLAGGTAAAATLLLPFWPPLLAVLLALAAAAATYVTPRLGLALVLFVPLFPLGNYAAGAAAAWGIGALAWLAVTWRDPRHGLLFVAGPVLAPLGALALLPLAVQPALRPWRRAAHAAAGVLAAALVAGVSGRALPFGAGDVGDLGLSGTESAGAVAQALAQTLADSPGLLACAAALAAAAAVLPFARARGPWGIACLGAGLLTATLLAAPTAPALPLVAGTWLLCGILALGDRR